MHVFQSTKVFQSVNIVTCRRAYTTSSVCFFISSSQLKQNTPTDVSLVKLKNVTFRGEYERI